MSTAAVGHDAPDALRKAGAVAIFKDMAGLHALTMTFA